LQFGIRGVAARNLNPVDAHQVLRGCTDTPGPPSREQIEGAVRQTLIGWGNELDEVRSLWGDWTRFMRDVETALRTGAAVDFEEACNRVEHAATQSLVNLRPLAARQSEGWVSSLPLGRSVSSDSSH
jgi:hypothetical protein